MKKALFGFAAVILFATSFQSFNTASKVLTVNVSDDSNSAVCYSGKAEDYNGNCVAPLAPTFEYEVKHGTIVGTLK